MKKPVLLKPSAAMSASAQEGDVVRRETGTENPVQEWEPVGAVGLARSLYVSPDGLRDEFVIAQVLHTVMTREDATKPIQIMMFDDRRHTPQGFPLTDEQMLHLKAQYNWDPNTGHEEFVWMTIADPDSSPPKLKSAVAMIRPGYTE